MKKNKIWIIGCGDIGRRVASLYKEAAEKNQTLFGIVQTDKSLLACKKDGIEAIRVDLDSSNSKAMQMELAGQFAKADLFYFAPPPAMGKIDVRLDNFLNNLDKGNLPRRVV